MSCDPFYSAIGEAVWNLGLATVAGAVLAVLYDCLCAIIQRVRIIVIQAKTGQLPKRVRSPIAHLKVVVWLWANHDSVIVGKSGLAVPYSPWKRAEAL